MAALLKITMLDMPALQVPHEGAHAATR
jgi:hypothetical protein